MTNEKLMRVSEAMGILQGENAYLQRKVVESDNTTDHTQDEQEVGESQSEHALAHECYVQELKKGWNEVYVVTELGKASTPPCPLLLTMALEEDVEIRGDQY